MRSPKSFQVAKDRILDCVSNHVERRNSRQRSTLPTRLIRVRQDVESSELSAHVSQSENLSPDTDYLSLSYCWGTAELLTATQYSDIIEYQPIRIVPPYP